MQIFSKIKLHDDETRMVWFSSRIVRELNNKPTVFAYVKDEDEEPALWDPEDWSHRLPHYSIRDDSLYEPPYYTTLPAHGLPPIDTLGPESQEFLQDYPDLSDDNKEFKNDASAWKPNEPDLNCFDLDDNEMPNVEFYRNIRPMPKWRLGIDTITRHFAELRHEMCLQRSDCDDWLFPHRYARNKHKKDSYGLTTREREIFRASPDLQARFLTLLDIMLDTYWYMHFSNRDLLQLTACEMIFTDARDDEWHGIYLLDKVLRSATEFGLEDVAVAIILFFQYQQSHGRFNDEESEGYLDQSWINRIRSADKRLFLTDVTRSVRREYVMSEGEYVAILKHRKETLVWQFNQTVDGSRQMIATPDHLFQKRLASAR